MILPIIPHQADPVAYTYVSGSFSVRRGLLLSIQELRYASAAGKMDGLIAALNRGSYTPISNDASPGGILARVEGMWKDLLARASRELPEPFLPYVLTVLDEREHAKAGLAEYLVEGTDLRSTETVLHEYAAYCRRIRTFATNSPEIMRESVFGPALRDALDAAESGASYSDAQVVFDFSLVQSLGTLARQYGHPAVISYVDGLRTLMIAGQALKAKLRSEMRSGAAIERLLPFLEISISERVCAVLDKISLLSWDMLQPGDLVVEASGIVLPSDRHYTPNERLLMLEDALDVWLVKCIESTGYEAYGVTVVFAYLVDFRREVWALRRLLKEAAAEALQSGEAGREA